MLAEDVQRRIGEGLSGATVTVQDLTGTGDHFEATVICPAFAGRSMVEQHKLVYATVEDLLGDGTLHALALKTYSPEQWQKFGGRR